MNYAQAIATRLFRDFDAFAATVEDADVRFVHEAAAKTQTASRRSGLFNFASGIIKGIRGAGA